MVAARPMITTDGNKRRRKTRLGKDARIAIIGSGLGGLGAALSLEQAGFTNVEIYERDASACCRREGYGLTLTYNPKGPLAQMGLLEQVAQCDCPSRSHYMFSPDGSILGYYGNTFLPNRGQGQRGNLRVPRQVLRQMMLDRVQSAAVHWGKRLSTFSESSNDKIQVEFDDGTIVDNVDLLIGADGIRSQVLQSLVGADDKNDTGLQYINIMIILGIADFCHAHLDERGFYTIDGMHRLFTMPYEGSQIDSTTKRRIMWQLSFRLENEEVAKRLSIAGPNILREEVLKRCSGWHQPVTDMVMATPLETIWGTGLMDRDPNKLLQQLNLRSSLPRVVVLGDAVHAMSPFKGQGANQALMDGPLLVSWLQNASIDSALKSFWREMCQRTTTKVLASRKAAEILHSPACLESLQDFAGVRPASIEHLLAVLKDRGIGAESGDGLDNLVQETIDELGCGNECSENTAESEREFKQQYKEALNLAAEGDCIGLRNLSLTCSKAICNARDEMNRSCLHLAVLGDHYNICRWLLTEAHVSPNVIDELGNTAVSYCSNDKMRGLFQVESTTDQVLT